MSKSSGFIPSSLYFRDVAFATIMITILLATSPAPVYAAGELEEVVVTARYREENLQETPLAITAMTAEDLDVRAMTTSYEVGYSIPNASFRPAQAAYGNTMTAYIRGIGQYDFNFAFEPGVGIYIDDVYFPTTMGSMMDLMDLERVEVLRGPQGTLFGRGSIGGAIRLVSKKPMGDNTGTIQVTTGEYNRVDLRASYDFAITDNLFARITGVSKSRDGYVDRIDFACAYPALAGNIPTRNPNRQTDCKLGTMGGEDVQGARGMLRWAPNDEWDVLVSVDYTNDKSEVRADALLNTFIDNTDAVNNFDPTITVPDGNPDSSYALWNRDIAMGIYGVNFDNRFVPSDPYVSFGTFDDPLVGLNFSPKTAIESYGVAGNIKWNINDKMNATAIISQRWYNGNFSVDHDESPLNDQLVNGIQKYKSFTAELRLNGTAFEDKLEYTLGYFHFDGKVDSTQVVNFPSLLYGILFNIPLPAFLNYPEGSQGTLVLSRNIWDTGSDAVYGHGVYQLTDRITLNAGFRWSNDSKAADFDNTIVQATLDSSKDRWDYKAGIDYQFTDDIMAYFSTATGYRPEAVNPRPFQITQFLPVSGEEATSYELGIKGDYFDNRVRLNVAGFYIDYGKRIVTAGGVECLADDNGNYTSLVPAGTPGATTDSLGNTCTGGTTSLTRYINEPGEILGVEVEGEWRPTDALTISGIFGMIDWSSNDPLNPEIDTPVYVPDMNWSVSASYEFNMSNGSTFTPRVDVVGQTEICSSAITVTSCSKGYELVNLRGEWASPSRTWTAAVGATNVNDRTYYLNKFDLTAFGQPTTEGQVGPPREWYLQVRRNF